MISPCVLILIGATAEGKKEVLHPSEQGQREDAPDTPQGRLPLTRCPHYARSVDRQSPCPCHQADGATEPCWTAPLEDWRSLPRNISDCWVHKTANVLDNFLLQICAKRCQAASILDMVSSRLDQREAASSNASMSASSSPVSDVASSMWKALTLSALTNTFFMTVLLHLVDTAFSGAKLLDPIYVRANLRLSPPNIATVRHRTSVITHNRCGFRSRPQMRNGV